MTVDGQADSYILPRLRLSGVWLTVYSGDIICKTNMFHLFHKFFSWFLIELTFDFYLLESIEVFLYFFYGSIFRMLWQLELEVQVSCRGHIWAMVIFDIEFSTWFQTRWHFLHWEVSLVFWNVTKKEFYKQFNNYNYVHI